MRYLPCYKLSGITLTSDSSTCTTVGLGSGSNIACPVGAIRQMVVSHQHSRFAHLIPAPSLISSETFCDFRHTHAWLSVPSPGFVIARNVPKRALARINHERIYCNRGFAATTGLTEQSKSKYVSAAM